MMGNSIRKGCQFNPFIRMLLLPPLLLGTLSRKGNTLLNKWLSGPF
jgi:hypothetical protein